MDFVKLACIALAINNVHPKLKLIQPEPENEFANLLSVGNKFGIQWLKSYMKVNLNTAPFLLFS